MNETLLPWIGGILSAVASFPQVYKCRKCNTTNDLHIGTILLRIFGAFIMVVYGIRNYMYAFVVVNTIIFICESLLLLFKIRDHYYRT